MSSTLVLINSAALLAAALVMVFAAVNDAVRFKIPNAASLALLALFPVFGLTSSHTVNWMGHLGVFVLILGVGYILYLKKWAGAGDIKLAASIGLWAGPLQWGPFLFVTAISGGIFSLGIGLISYLKNRSVPKENRKELGKTPIPYGVAIAVGGLCTLALLSHPELLPRG